MENLLVANLSGNDYTTLIKLVNFALNTDKRLVKQLAELTEEDLDSLFGIREELIHLESECQNNTELKYPITHDPYADIDPIPLAPCSECGSTDICCGDKDNGTCVDHCIHKNDNGAAEGRGN